MSNAKDVSILFTEDQVSTGQELHGNISIEYKGRFDSVVINSQIENSSDIFTYSSVNGKKTNFPYARMPVFKADLGDKRTIDFVASTKHIPHSDSSVVKFRVSIIQEHKEVASDVVYVKVVAQE